MGKVKDIIRDAVDNISGNIYLPSAQEARKSTIQKILDENKHAEIENISFVMEKDPFAKHTIKKINSTLNRLLQNPDEHYIGLHVQVILAEKEQDEYAYYHSSYASLKTSIVVEAINNIKIIIASSVPKKMFGEYEFGSAKERIKYTANLVDYLRNVYSEAGYSTDRFVKDSESTTEYSLTNKGEISFRIFWFDSDEKSYLWKFKDSSQLEAYEKGVPMQDIFV